MTWIQNENNFSNIDIQYQTEIVDIFSEEWKKQISLNSDLNYLIISSSPNIDISIHTKKENTKSKIFWIFYSDSKLPTAAKISINLENDNTETEVYFLSIINDNQTISVDGSINMAKWVKKVSWTLLEENLVFGNNISIKTKPILNIYSNDVKASHGARIQRIDADKMFYLTSKWISWPGSEKLILDWYVDHILDQFKSIDKELLKSKIIK